MRGWRVGGGGGLGVVITPGPVNCSVYEGILEVTIASEVLPCSISLASLDAQMNVKVLY